MDWFEIVYNFLRQPGIEGEKLTAYPDPGTGGAPWTIGVGHTGFVDGKPVAPGMKISLQKSKELLLADIAVAAKAVDKAVTWLILDQQKAALVSLAFNIGADAFSKSTLVKKLNAGDLEGAANEFPRWNKAKGKILPGLVTRRELEKRMFKGEYYA